MPVTFLRNPSWIQRGQSAIALVLLLAGCRPPQTAATDDTHVGRGELFRTGQVSYDRYFADLYGVSTEIARAPSEQQTACGDLIYALGLPPTVPEQKLAEVLHDKAQDVEKSGHRYRVEGYSAVTEGPKPDDDARSLGRSLDGCLRAHGALIARWRKVPERTQGLVSVATALEPSIDDDFFGFKRQEVHTELTASRRVLSALDEKASALVNESEKTVLDLTAAVMPPQRATTETKPEAVPEKKKNATKRPAAASPPSPRAPTNAPPAEKKPPKPKPKGDDFNP